MAAFEIKINYETDGMDGPRDLQGIMDAVQRNFPQLAMKFVNVTKCPKVSGRHIPPRRSK